MNYYALKGAVTLLFASGAARGQAPDSAGAASRWYVGGGAAIHSYFSIGAPYYRIKPAYLMGGYIVKPRLAIQAEAQYSRRNEESDGGNSVIDGEVFNFRTKSQTTSTALTVLARFSRSRPQRPLQFDWLLGLAIVRGSLSETVTRTSATRSERYVFPTTSATEPHVVAGVSLRYLVGPRLAIGAEVLLNKNLYIPPYSWGIIPGGGASLGVSYLLGKDKR